MATGAGLFWLVSGVARLARYQQNCKWSCHTPSIGAGVQGVLWWLYCFYIFFRDQNIGDHHEYMNGIWTEVAEKTRDDHQRCVTPRKIVKSCLATPFLWTQHG